MRFGCCLLNIFQLMLDKLPGLLRIFLAWNPMAQFILSAELVHRRETWMSLNIPAAEAVAELKRFDAEFRAADAEEQTEFASVPDGKYEVTVEKVDLGRTPNAGYVRITWHLRVTGPTHQSRMLWKSSVITNNSLRFVKSELRKCGLALDDLSALPSQIDKMVNVDLSITKRTNNGYENIYFDRRLDTGVTDDLPF